MKKIKYSQLEKTAIKRIAQNVYSLEEKKSLLVKKINILEDEILKINDVINQFETPLKSITESDYKSIDLVEKITSKNKQGITVSRYTFRFPDTILPLDESITLNDNK